MNGIANDTADTSIRRGGSGIPYVVSRRLDSSRAMKLLAIPIALCLLIIALSAVTEAFHQLIKGGLILVGIVAGLALFLKWVSKRDAPPA